MSVEESLCKGRKGKPRGWLAVIACGCYLSLFLPSALRATPFNPPDEIYPSIIIEQDVRVVLREFGQNLGVSVQLGSQVSGTVKGKLSPLKSLDFLNQVCQMNSLQWYFDGSVLYISSASEQETRFISLTKAVSLETLTGALRQLSFYDERYPLRRGPDGASVVISGPPAYVGVIERTLASMHAIHPETPAETVIYRGASISTERFGPSRKQ